MKIRPPHRRRSQTGRPNSALPNSGVIACTAPPIHPNHTLPGSPWRAVPSHPRWRRTRRRCAGSERATGSLVLPPGLTRRWAYSGARHSYSWPPRMGPATNSMAAHLVRTAPPACLLRIGTTAFSAMWAASLASAPTSSATQSTITMRRCRLALQHSPHVRALLLRPPISATARCAAAHCTPRGVCTLSQTVRRRPTQATWRSPAIVRDQPRTTPSLARAASARRRCAWARGFTARAPSLLIHCLPTT